MSQCVYSFGAGHNEGRADMKNLLGGKGANLAEMASIGLPVPPGFTITTEVCTAFYQNDRRYPEDLDAQVRAALARIEQGLATMAGDERFAWDSYRRFIQMYGSVVLGVEHHRFEEIIEHAKLEADVLEDTALTPAH